MDNWALEKINFLVKSLSQQINRATTIAQNAWNSYNYLQNQYDTNVIISTPVDGRTSQNVSVSTSFGNDNDDLAYVPEFTYLVGSRLRYNRILSNTNTDPLEVVNFQSVRNMFSEFENMKIGATEAWVSENFLGLVATATNSDKLNGFGSDHFATSTDYDALHIWVTSNFLGLHATADDSARLGGTPASLYALNSSLANYLQTFGTAYNSERLGGVLAANYATQAWVTANSLSTHATVDNSLALGGILAASYATQTWVTSNFLGIHATADNALSLGGNIASAYSTTSAMQTWIASHYMPIASNGYYNEMEDFTKEQSSFYSFISYNFTSSSIKYGGYARIAKTTTPNHPGVVELYSKNTTDISDTVPFHGTSDGSDYSVGYYYGGPFSLDNTSDNSITVRSCFKLLDITNNKFILGLLSQWSPTTETAVDGIYINIVNGILTAKTANSSTATSSTNYSLTADNWYTLEITLNLTATTPGIIFTLYDSTLTSVWTQTLSTNLPLNKILYMTMGIATMSTDSDFPIVQIDYLKHSINTPLVR